MKLLRIVGSTEANNPSLEVDNYIPIAFRCPKDVVFPAPFYWVVGDEYSLIEIGISSLSKEGLPPMGAICKITVTQLKELIEYNSYPDVTLANTNYGLPVCDVTPWDLQENRFLEINTPFFASLTSNRFSICFDKSQNTNKIYVVDDVIFGVTSSGHLHSLHFTNLDGSDVQNIISCLP